MMELGTQIPAFALTDVLKNKEYSENTAFGSKGLAVFFICNHCPFVVHVADTISKLANEFQEKGIGFIAINSNDVEAYPEDSPEKMVEFANKYLFDFPYCFDEKQDVAKSFDAACTPDIFLFDKNKSLVYRGQLDDSRPGNSIPSTGVDLKAAMEDLLAGRKVSELQKPSIGCNIKWK